MMRIRRIELYAAQSVCMHALPAVGEWSWPRAGEAMAVIRDLRPAHERAGQTRVLAIEKLSSALW